jgi:glyoxylase-like metal-dependent hydrolase (beta-lactamase superfamily II)
VSSTIHRYASGESGIFANAYLIETADGTVAVDALLSESDSRAFRAKFETLGKPLLAVLLTHGHPDHYNGVTNLIGSNRVPVIATGGVDRVIRENDETKERQWKPVFGEEWPKRRTFPNRIVGDGEVLRFGDLTFTVHDLGPGESHSDSIWITSGADCVAFIGDVVIHRMHAYMADGHTTAWLRNLERVRSLLGGVERVYPGHGEPGSVDMLDWQKHYLKRFRAEVAALAGARTALSEQEKQMLVTRMKEDLPTNKLEFLIGLGADSVASELVSNRT